MAVVLVARLFTPEALNLNDSRFLAKMMYSGFYFHKTEVLHTSLHGIYMYTGILYTPFHGIYTGILYTPLHGIYIGILYTPLHGIYTGILYTPLHGIYTGILYTPL